MTKLALLGIAASAVGVSLAFFVGKVPSRGWVAIILLLSAALAWILINSGRHSRPSSTPMELLFRFITPVAVIYSFRAKSHAPDRLPALAAFVGAFIMAAFYLLQLFILALLIYSSFRTKS